MRLDAYLDVSHAGTVRFKDYELDVSTFKC